MLVTAEDVDTRRIDPNWRVLDARATERYHGNNETLDPIAGHIPGAVTTPYQANLAPDGKFHSVEVLKDRYQEILASVPVEHSIVYCGSGVTATHSILAMLHAGLGEPKLYAGSWSEWITDPNHQVAT
jgi:thiosulfate/3-mercaptopyruvate sulfurtransferase